MVEPGSTYNVEGILFQIIETHRYYDVAKRSHLLVSYRIKDGSYVSPIAHFNISLGADPKDLIKKIVIQYLRSKQTITG